MEIMVMRTLQPDDLFEVEQLGASHYGAAHRISSNRQTLALATRRGPASKPLRHQPFLHWTPPHRSV